MLEIATKLCALFLLAATGPAVAQGTLPTDAAPQQETMQTDQLCSYCQDYTDAAMAAGPVTTAYQVGAGYPQVAQSQELARQEPPKSP